jgi:excisionase family DNA binding protein
MSRETYNLAEAGRILGVARTTLARQAAAGAIPAIRIGSRWLIPKTYIDRLFDEAGCPREETANV